MKPISDFFPRILPFVPGCPEPLLRQAICDAAIDFCEESMAVRQFIAPITTVANQAAYTIADTTHETIARILVVKVDNTPILPVPVEVASTLTSSDPSTPVAYYTTRTDSTFVLNLFQSPDRAYTLDIEVAYKPLRGAEQFQDDLFNRWVDAISNGAIGKIQTVPGQAFSDPNGANRILYAMQLARKARVESTKGRLRSSASVRPLRFA